MKDGVVRRTDIRLDSSLHRTPSWNCASSRARLILRCEGLSHPVTLYDSNGPRERWNDPLEAVDWMQRHIQQQAPGCRWVGYFSYDFGRLFEVFPANAQDDLGLPLFLFAFIDDSCPACEQVETLPPKAAAVQVSSTFSRDAYLRAVARGIEYIRAGDVFQVNLSQRFSVASAESPAQIYRRLLASTPASYGAFLDLGDHALICNSPELFLRVTPDPQTGERHVITRPIKGTRPRIPGMEAELRDSVKDAAELNMIIDLERNDLGRVCRVGSVKVAQPRTIETHPTVLHGVATVEGTLRDEVSLVDLLRATFPGGSITGAPKIRAMQIIDELEPVRRGPYCGAIGYLASDGTMEFNIAIRTMIASRGQIHIPVGGGIVADSDPASEYEETLVKARAMFAALGLSLPNEQGRIQP